MTHHQYGISAHVSQISIHEETSGGVAKCQLFSQADKQALPFAIASLVFDSTNDIYDLCLQLALLGSAYIRLVIVHTTAAPVLYIVGQ